MVPPTILRQLNRLRVRKRWLRLVWSVTLAVAILAAVLLAACLTDWIIDRYQDTPWRLRVALFGIQLCLWVAAGIAVFVWSFHRRLSDDDLALYVEDKAGSFGHRLISALQLNRPNADTKGMSPAMIAATTKQAEEQAGQANFASLADHSRIDRAGKLGIGLAIVVAVLVVIGSDTIGVLLARQLLADREIPRSVRLESVTEAVWPSGEEVVLKFRVRGHHLGDGTEGEVKIYPKAKDAPSESYPLVFESSVGHQEAIYTAHVRPGTISYDYRGWLRDGRTRQAAKIQLEPRPAIIKQDAWVQLPNYVGLRPDGKPYEMFQPRADIAGLAASSARVVVKTQKPVVSATLELLGRPPAEALFALPGPIGDPPGFAFGGLVAWLVPLAAMTSPDAASTSDAGAAVKSLIPELVRRRMKMRIDKEGTQAEAMFDLRPGETAYRITVADEYKFVNLDPPRRTIRIETEEPPTVALLPERLIVPGQAVTEENDLEGVPILHKNKFRVAYTASSPYGLGKAVMRYRINEEGDWLPLPLKEVKGTEQTGPFNPKFGAFDRSEEFAEVEFHRMLSPDLKQFPPGTDGGGRFDFKTAGLNLKVGDKIEFFVEVYDRNPDPNRAPGKTEVRQKTVVDLDTYLAWISSVTQEERRIGQLEIRQRDVFGSSLVSDTTPPSTGGTRKPPLGLRPANTFVRNWQIIGPFPNDNDGKGFDAAYPPEQEKTVNLSAEHDGIKGKIRWKVYHSPIDKIDLEAFLKHSDAGVAYARCWFRATDDKAILATGSDDGIKVWIDGKEVLSRKLRRDAVPGEDKTPIKLNDADWHEMLVKIDNRTASWAFYLELLDDKGKGSLDGLQFRTTPPGEDEKRFVRDWLLIGAFPNVGDKGRDKAWPPETEPVDLDKEYDGIAGKVKWKEHKSETGRIGFDKYFERPFNESNLAYAVCWVKSDRDRTATLATGSDDGIKVWVNRKLRIDAAVSREAEPGKDIQSVPLKKGWNELLVKVDNRFGRWAFYFELRDPDTERPLEELTFSTTPPKE